MMKLTILVITVFSGILQCKDLYVSFAGKDDGNNDCGQKMPCNTLERAFEFSKNNDCILLDGGKRYPQIYEVRFPILLTHSIIIKKSTDSLFQPIIKTVQDNIKNFIFQVKVTPSEQHKQIRLKLRDLKIVNINLLKVVTENPRRSAKVNETYKHLRRKTANTINTRNGTKKIDIIIENCPVENSEIMVDSSRVEDLTNRLSVSLKVMDCSPIHRIMLSNKYLLERLKIIDSVMYSSRIFVESSKSVIIQNSTFKDDNQSLNSSTFLHFSTVENVYLEKVRFQGSRQQESSPLVKIIGGPIIRSNAQFNDVSLIYSHTDFLIYAKYTNLKFSNISFINNKKCKGIFIENSEGNLRNITAANNNFVGNFLYLRDSNFTVNKLEAIHNHFERIIFVVNDSNVNARSIRLSNNYLEKELQLVFIARNSKFYASSVILSNNNNITYEAIGVRSSDVSFSDLKVWNNTFHQMLYFQLGNLTLSNVEIFKNNGSKSTLIGVNEGWNFIVTSLNISHNTIGANVIHVIDVNNCILKNLQVVWNSFKGCINIERSKLILSNVYLINNAVTSTMKVLGFTEKKEHSSSIEVENITAVFEGFKGIYQTDSYYYLNIGNTRFSFRNVTTTVQNVRSPIPEIKMIDLNMNTKSPPASPQMTFNCPANFKVRKDVGIQAETMTLEVKCIQCDKDTYSLETSSLLLNDIEHEDIDVSWKVTPEKEKIFNTSQTYHKCLSCPPGGNCENGIHSQGNYYGYLINKNAETSLVANRQFGGTRTKMEVEFITCPKTFCCSKQGKSCDHFNTCNFHRTGLLCGQCEENYYEDFFTTNCIEKSECTSNNQHIFWFLFTLSAVILTSILCFARDVGTALRCFLYWLKKVRNKKRKKMSEDTKVINNAFAVAFHISNATITPHHKSSNLCTYIELNPEPFYKYKDCVFINNCLNYEEKKKYTFSGVLQILITFFQISALISVSVNSKKAHKIYEKILDLFNLELTIRNVSALCPYNSLNSVTKLFIKKFLFIVFMIAIVTFTFFLVHIYELFVASYRRICVKRQSVSKDEDFYKLQKDVTTKVTSFKNKLALTCLKIIMFGYKNITFFSLNLMNCVSIGGRSVLYINGNIACSTVWWQSANYAFFFLWVLPLPSVLPVLYYLFKKRAINFKIFLFSISFPLITPIVFILRKNRVKFRCHGENNARSIRQDVKFEMELREKLYELFEEPYRLHYTTKHPFIYWETLRLYERLVVAIVATFIVDPIVKMCALTPILLAILWMHYHLKPYKKTMTVLAHMDIFSYVCLCYHIVDNTFKSVVYSFDIPPDVKPIKDALNVFQALSYFFSPLVYLLGYFIYIGSKKAQQALAKKKV